MTTLAFRNTLVEHAIAARCCKLLPSTIDYCAKHSLATIFMVVRNACSVFFGNTLTEHLPAAYFKNHPFTACVLGMLLPQRTQTNRNWPGGNGGKGKGTLNPYTKDIKGDKEIKNGQEFSNMVKYSSSNYPQQSFATPSLGTEQNWCTLQICEIGRCPWVKTRIIYTLFCGCIQMGTNQKQTQHMQ